jgi:hypothetical protein
MANSSSSLTGPRTSQVEIAAGFRSSSAATIGWSVVSNLRILRYRSRGGGARSLVLSFSGEAIFASARLPPRNLSSFHFLKIFSVAIRLKTYAKFADYPI